ncbi:MAG: hypothetical protein ACKESB_02600 [Candidatus Hodgkinia cicadicola]
MLPVLVACRHVSVFSVEAVCNWWFVSVSCVRRSVLMCALGVALSVVVTLGANTWVQCDDWYFEWVTVDAQGEA